MNSRTVIQQLIDSNVFDNNNKEILASMLRDILEEIMNSDFNKTDDQLQNLKYNNTLTLAQKFNETPQIIKAYVGNFDINSTTGNLPFTGPISTAVISVIALGRSKIVINFIGIDVIEKSFVINIVTTAAGDDILVRNTDNLGLTYRRDSTSQITIALTELNPVTHDIGLEILIF